ncbi:hypothetical protein NUSPORA_00911 [Nucleospora cyclopteri]
MRFFTYFKRIKEISKLKEDFKNGNIVINQEELSSAISDIIRILKKIESENLVKNQSSIKKLSSEMKKESIEKIIEDINKVIKAVKAIQLEILLVSESAECPSDFNEIIKNLLNMLPLLAGTFTSSVSSKDIQFVEIGRDWERSIYLKMEYLKATTNNQLSLQEMIIFLIGFIETVMVEIEGVFFPQIIEIVRESLINDPDLLLYFNELLAREINSNFTPEID